MNKDVKEFFETTDQLLKFRKSKNQEIKDFKRKIHLNDVERKYRAKDLSLNKKVNMDDPNFSKILQRDVLYCEISDCIAYLETKIEQCKKRIELIDDSIKCIVEEAREKEIFCVNYKELRNILYMKGTHFNGIGLSIDDNFDEVLGDILWDYYTEKNSKEECSERIASAMHLKINIDSKRIPVKLSKKLKGCDFRFADLFERNDNRIKLNKISISSQANLVFDPKQILEIKKNVYLPNKDGGFDNNPGRLCDLLNAICSCLDFDYEKEFKIGISENAEQQ